MFNESAKRATLINMPRQLRQIFQELYETIFRMDTTVRAKVVCLENIVHEDERFVSWRVVGITRNALKALAAVDFRVPQANIRRAHKVSRRDRGNELFNGDEPMPNAYDFFFEHDSVTLTTAIENRRHGCEHWSEEFPLDLSDLQRGRTPFAALGSRAEIERVKALYSLNLGRAD